MQFLQLKVHGRSKDQSLIYEDSQTVEASKTISRRQVYAPKHYAATFVTMNGLLVAGFVPAVVVYMRKSRWWLNPVLQPEAWGNINTFSMSLHGLITSAWIGISLFQFGITGIPNYLRSNWKLVGVKALNVRSVHRAAGYSGLVVCVGMVVSAMHLTKLHAVAGKITNNGFAVGTSAAMIYHLVKGIAAVRGKNKNINTHLWHMAGLFTWTCFPGFARSLGVLPAQQMLFGSSPNAFDVLQTSGFMVLPLTAAAIGHHLLQYFILGPNCKVQMKDYAVYAIGAALDVSLGLIDGSLLKRPERPLLAQVPGRPWELQATPL